MDLPPCPVCGEGLEMESPQGPVKCQSCGFTGRAEVDREAVGRLLEEASHRGLGPRTMLAPAGEAPEPLPERGRSPSMLEGTKAPELPQLSPPPVPRELSMGAPPPMADPRRPLHVGREEMARTPMGDTLEEREEARKRELNARGELLR